MADDNYIAPSDVTPDGKTKLGGEKTVSDDVQKLSEGKFKTQEELAKAYKDLEKKLGEQSDDIRKSREYADLVNPLLEEIRNDPEIFHKLDERLRTKGQPNNSQEDKASDTKTTDPDEMRTVASDLLLARFEESHGIDKLSSEDQKILRNNIGSIVFDLTDKPLAKVDLRKQGAILEYAYKLAAKDSKKSTSEDESSAQGDASISSIPSSSEKGQTTLTPEEAKIAEKLSLTREQYLEGKTGLTKKKS